MMYVATSPSPPGIIVLESDGDIARMVGCKSAQAVGQAVGANPMALLIPCHRVIASHGKIGGYEYGIEIKKRLLKLELQCPAEPMPE